MKRKMIWWKSKRGTLRPGKRARDRKAAGKGCGRVERGKKSSGIRESSREGNAGDKSHYQLVSRVKGGNRKGDGTRE